MATKRILVVDDDSYVRGATEEILIRKGYNVDTAGEVCRVFSLGKPLTHLTAGASLGQYIN